MKRAINNSKTRKGRNPEILNAIGRANADGPSTVGDPAYAIEKLKRAAELMPDNPDVYLNLGINYLGNYTPVATMLVKKYLSLNCIF